VSACAAQKELTWVRVDGKPFVANQFEVDRTVCNGEIQKSGQAEGDFRSCMAQRGYRQQAIE